MNRSRGEANAVDLFPFTAVLLSVMGVLIILLFGITSRGLAQEAESVPALERAHVDVLELAAAIAEMNPKNEQASRELGQRRADQARYVEENHDRENRLAELAGELEKARARRRDRPSIDIAALRVRITELTGLNKEAETLLLEERKSADKMEDAADAREEQLEVLQAEVERMKGRLLVVWNGESETDLSPVYMDCTAAELIQVGGGRFKLGVDDKAWTVEDNAFMEHLKRLEKEKRYPVFIVRPSGLAYYRLAVLLSRRVGSSFGYLVVDDDVVLEYPEGTEES